MRVDARCDTAWDFGSFFSSTISAAPHSPLGVGAKSEPDGTLTFSFVSAVKRALARFCAADTELLRLPIIVSVRLMRDCAVARSARAALGIAISNSSAKFRHESAEC